VVDGFGSPDAVEASADALRSNPLNPMAAIDLVQARMVAFAAIGQLQEAATTAAAELRAASGDQGEEGSWWNPFSWFDEDDPTVPTERVSDNIMDDDAFDPEDVDQGSIGDCFMLSTVVSLLGTDEGDDFLRENIRWDDDKEGYWVTLYQGGEPTEVFVDHVFDDGARQEDGGWWIFQNDKPSIAALYESALREEYGYSFIDGGVPAEAMEIITGRDVTVVENSRDSGYAGLDADQMSGMRDVLDDGGQVVISSPRSGEHQLTVTNADGDTREIDVVNSHSYAVSRIEPNGDVWMRNPWGPGNGADGGGEFRVSAADVEDLFWRVTATNITQ
jgi:hypothetical protein